jgi:hypothetical protein
VVIAREIVASLVDCHNDSSTFYLLGFECGSILVAGRIYKPIKINLVDGRARQHHSLPLGEVILWGGWGSEEDSEEGVAC